MSTSAIYLAGFGVRLPGGVHSVADALDAFRSGESRLSATAGPHDPPRLWADDAAAQGVIPPFAGLVHNCDLFDPAFFGISPRVAAEMDPQQRWALMCAVEAIRESGISLKTLQSMRTGVMVGAGSNDNLVTTFKQPQCFNPYTMQGGTLGNIANLVSFYLDLHGCSATVDTACSSSLTALHLARQSLEAGDLDAALVIGTNFLLQPDGFLGFGAAHMLSPTGQSRPFHRDANGFVRAEGCVAVLLVREQPDVKFTCRSMPYARLVRSGVNENGRNTSVTQPQVEAQRVLLEEVVHEEDLPRVAFIEAHGTGTAVGDPIESRSICDRFAAGAGRPPVAIGSSKAVFGHLETGSGLVGLLRAALALRHRLVFAQPQLGDASNLNPAVLASFTADNTRASPVFLPFEESSLPKVGDDALALAVINSFGYGGANACVLLEQAPLPIVSIPVSPAPAGMVPVFLRAVSAEHLTALQERVSQVAPWHQNIAIRLNSAVGSGSGLLDKVGAVGFCSTSSSDGVPQIKWTPVSLPAAPSAANKATQSAPTPVAPAPKVAFVFGGQGTQHPRMGIDLYNTVPSFRESIDRGDAAYKKLSGFSLRDDHGFCVREMSAESLQDVRISLPCIVLCQVALVDALSAASVFPMAVLGHSTGEIASAYAHGLTQLDDIVRAVYGRALGQHMMPDGLMMALFCSEADFNAVHESLTHKDRVYISARNAPRALTLSGSPEGIQEAFAACSKAGLKSIIVPHIQRAYHSPDTYCMRDSFLADMNQLKLPQQSWRIGRQPIVPEFISSVTGRRMPTPELDVQYWWQNVCCPVEFVAGCQELAKMEPAVVVEIGSHAVLQRFVNDTFAVPFLATQSSRSPNALTDFTRALLTLQSEHRVAVDWSVLHFKSSSTDDNSDWSACPLPWIEGSFRSAAWKCGPPIPSKTSSASSASVHSEASSSSRRSLTSASHLDAPVQRSQPRVAVPASRAVASKSVAPVSVSSKSEALDVGFVIDHQIRGNAICPGSLFAGEAIRSAPTTSSATVTVAQLEWRQTVSHPWNGVEAKASTGVTGTNGAIAYNLADDAMRFQRPAAATSAPAPLQFAGQWVDTASMSTAYASLREWCKIEFGPRFRLLKTIRSDSARCWLLASGTWRDHNDGENRWSVCLPTVLDAAFQACGMLVPLSNLAWVPSKLAQLTTHGLRIEGTTAFSVLCHLTAVGSNSFTFDFDLLVGDALYAQGRGFEMRSLGAPSAEVPPIHEQIWRSISCPSDAAESSFPKAPASLIRLDISVQDSWKNVVMKVGSLLKPEANPTASKAAVLLTWPSSHPESGQLRGWSRSLRTERFNETGALTYAVSLESDITFPSGNIPPEYEINWNGSTGAFSIPRVVEWKQPSSSGREQKSNDHPVVVHCAGGGFSVQWLSSARTCRLDPDQVRVKITHTALHFKDVMLALGLLPGFALRLGLEACGVVTECGADCKFKVGQRVLVLDFGTSDTDSFGRPKPSLLATEVVVSSNQCFAANNPISSSVSSTWGDDGWAGFLGVYATSWKALEGVRPGDKVLIHSALGGVGQSAIQIARHLGAEIYASAGSPSRRQQLSEKLGIPIERILDSHHPNTWAEHMQTHWNGRGVDWVLNSLAGEAIPSGMRLLAPGGTFVEIGKRDIWDGTPLSMALFRDNITFRSVHLDLLSDTHPHIVRHACEACLELLVNGHVTPVPTEVVPATELSFALRRMSQGKHQGKVVIDVASILNPPVPAESSSSSASPQAKLPGSSPHRMLRLDGTYVVTGCTSGVGLAYVVLLLNQGVRHVVLLSRSNKLNERAALTLSRFVGRYSVVAESDWSSILATYKPSGVIHFAAHYTAGAALDWQDQGWEETQRAKAAVWQSLVDAVNKAACEVSEHLDFIATTTSLAGMYGNDMQAAYAAANVTCVETSRPLRSTLISTQSGSTVVAVCMDLPMVLGAGRLSDHLFGGELWYNAKKGFRALSCFSLFTALHTVVAAQLENPDSIAQQKTCTHILVEPTPFHDVAARISNPNMMADLVKLESVTQVASVSAAEEKVEIETIEEEIKSEAVVAATGASSSAIQVSQGPSISPDAVTAILRDQLSIVLGLAEDKITASWSEPLSDVGLDSLGAMELRSWMQKSGAWDPSVLTPSLLLAPGTSCQTLVELSQLAQSILVSSTQAATAKPVSRSTPVVKPISSKPVASKPAVTKLVVPIQHSKTIASSASTTPIKSSSPSTSSASSFSADQVSAMLREQLSIVLGLAEDKVTASWSEPLSDVGLDSLGAMELRSWMQKSGAWDPSVLTPSLLLAPDTSCQTLIELAGPSSTAPVAPAVSVPAKSTVPAARSVPQPVVKVSAKPASKPVQAVSKPAAVAAPSTSSPVQQPSSGLDKSQVTAILRDQLSIVLGLAEDKVTASWSEPLSDVGLDSLGAMELRSWMQKSGAWDPSVLTPSLLLAPGTSCQTLVDLAQGGASLSSSSPPTSTPQSNHATSAARSAPSAQKQLTKQRVARVESAYVSVDGPLEVRGHFDSTDCADWIVRLRMPVSEAGALVVHLIDAIGMDLSQGNRGFASQSDTLDGYAELLTALERTQRPILVVSDGFVRGGSMIWAMHATCHVCTPDTTFGFPEVLHGGLPALVSSGSSYRGLQLGQLRRYLITGDPISSDDGVRIGLVDVVANAWADALSILDKWSETVGCNVHQITKSELPYPSRQAATVALGRALQSPDRKQQLDEEQLNEESGLIVTTQFVHPEEDGQIADEERDYIATVELVDVEKHNALSLSTARALRRFADEWRNDSRLRAIVIMPGADAAHFGSGLHNSLVDYWKSCMDGDSDGPNVFTIANEVFTLYDGYTALRQVPVPIVALVSGAAVGGGLAFALNADVRMATSESRFIYGNRSRGVCPGLHLSKWLVDALGFSRAIDWYRDENMWNANQALAEGVLHSVYPNRDAMWNAAMEYLQPLLNSSVEGVRQTLNVLRAPLDQQRLWTESVGMAECMRNGAFSSDTSAAVAASPMASKKVASAPRSTMTVKPSSVSSPAAIVKAAAPPAKFGIEAMSVYIPVNRVTQEDLEKIHKCEGKYTRGLGQRTIAIPSVDEDPVSMAFTAISRLLEATGEPRDIGFLAVATESMVDRSKSIKSELAERLGLSDTEGTDVYHACYGSTGAILWALDWLRSGRGKGKRAIVVSTDIAEWGPDYCFLNGAAAVAVLLGPKPVVELDADDAATVSYNGFDFCKPLEQPYPVFDGPSSVDSLTGALKKCLARVPWGDSDFSYLVPHCTTAMMCRRASDATAEFFQLPASVKADYFARKVDPCTKWVRNIGSMFTAAMWVNLACLLSQGQAVGTNIALYSYGSGTMGTLWRARVVRPLPANSKVIVQPEGFRDDDQSLLRFADAADWLAGERSVKFTTQPGAYALISESQPGHRKYSQIEEVIESKEE